MSRVGIFLADGFEEIEGLTVVDILRRAGIDISMISINGKKKVTGAHGIALDTDEDIVQCDLDKLCQHRHRNQHLHQQYFVVAEYAFVRMQLPHLSFSKLWLQ